MESVRGASEPSQREYAVSSVKGLARSMAWTSFSKHPLRRRPEKTRVLTRGHLVLENNTPAPAAKSRPFVKVIFYPPLR